MSITTNIHGLNPDSLSVEIQEFSNFVSCTIKAKTVNKERVSFTLFFEENDGVDMHDTLVTLRALFPRHTYENNK